MATAQLPTAGQVIGNKYVIEKKLGEGGMGAVFAARNRDIDKPVAIKIMLADPSNPEALQRFRIEGRNAGKLKSQHVAEVLDVGEDNGMAFMVLELLHGQDLAQILEEHRRLEPHVAVGYVIQCLEGVKLAHANGIVHRDLKPSNLFLAKNADGTQVVKVFDFGISKQSAGALGQAPSALTSTKAMLGSPLYVAPEQVRSSRSVDARADIWAIGVILYELVTGTVPFTGDHLGELFAQIIEEEPTPVRVRAPSVSPQLEAIILKCLQKRPDDRFQNAQDLINALRPFTTPMLMGTVAMSGPSPFAASGYPSGPPGASITGNQMTTTPHNPPLIAGATTGSGVHPPVVVPPGASLTPQAGDFRTTAGTKKSNVGFTVAIAALGGIALLVAGVFAIKHDKHGWTTASSAPVAATTAPEPPPAPSATEAASAPVTVPAASSAAPSASAPSSRPVHLASTAPKPPPKPPEPPKLAPAPAPPATSAPPQKPKSPDGKPGGQVQDDR